MRNFTLFLLGFFITISTSWSQQGRYAEPVFDEVETSQLTVLQTNYTVMPWVFGLLSGVPGGGSTLQPLRAQFYYPKEDTANDRPLVIYLHTGNFIPFAFNGSCGGTVQDSSNVEIATRLAKLGYVVAVVEYRQGWLPTIEQELLKRYTLINAAYRGVQDVNTYIRYFKKSVAEQNNPHGIDPEKIVVWGQGTGGYLSLASAYLNQYSEILTTSDPNKFRFPVSSTASVPMVTENYNGTINGDGPITVSNAMYIPTASLGFKSGDTLSKPNHVGYNSDYALTVNMGGALGDSTWVSEGETPLISFHVTSDAFAPCKTAVLRVPTARGPENVVEVSGSCDVANIADRLGLNDVFKTIPAGKDPFNTFNKSSNLGFYQFENTPNNSSAPWEWTYAQEPKPGQEPKDCNIDANIAKTYIDTVLGYYIPRACVALNLDCFSSSTKNLSENDVNLSVSPNPAHDIMYFTTKESTPMKSIEVVDMTGRILFMEQNIRNSYYELKKNQLAPGMYFVKISFESGNLLKKVLFF